MGELLLFAKNVDALVPLTLPLDATIGDLRQAVKAAMGLDGELRYQGELLEGDLQVLADTGLSQQAVVDVDGISEEVLRLARWAFVAAGKREDHERLRKLLKEGAPASWVNKEQWRFTLLHEAAWEGNATGVKILLEAGAAIDARNNDGGTPLHRAVATTLGAPTDCVRVLCEAGAPLNAKNKDGLTPMDFARKWKRTGALRILKEFGAK